MSKTLFTHKYKKIIKFIRLILLSRFFPQCFRAHSFSFHSASFDLFSYREAFAPTPVLDEIAFGRAFVVGTLMSSIAEFRKAFARKVFAFLGVTCLDVCIMFV